MRRKTFKFWNPALICFVVAFVVSMILLVGMPIGAFFDGTDPSLSAFRPLDSRENRLFGVLLATIIASYLASGVSVGRGRAVTAINIVSCLFMIAATCVLLLNLAGVALGQAMQH